MEKNMTNMQKYAAIAITAIIAGSYLLTVFLNAQYKSKLEKLATQTMGVPVTIGEVSHSPVSKSLRLANIYIKNPKGFDSPNMAYIDDIRLIADQMDQDPAMIENLFINRLVFFYDYSKELNSSNMEFFYHYQQNKYNSIQQKDQTDLRINNLYIANPVIKPTDNAIMRLSERVSLPMMEITKIGYGKNDNVTIENSMPYHTTLIIQATIRAWTKYKLKATVTQANDIARKLGEEVSDIGSKVTNEALDLSHEVDKELRNFGTFLGEQINSLTDNPDEQQ